LRTSSAWIDARRGTATQYGKGFSKAARALAAGIAPYRGNDAPHGANSVVQRSVDTHVRAAPYPRACSWCPHTPRRGQRSGGRRPPRFECCRRPHEATPDGIRFNVTPPASVATPHAQLGCQPHRRAPHCYSIHPSARLRARTHCTHRAPNSS
jgi:hypothetical protein